MNKIICLSRWCFIGLNGVICLSKMQFFFLKIGFVCANLFIPYAMRPKEFADTVPKKYPMTG